MTTALLAFSGGLDSTYILWRLLQEGKHVHAHHISMQYKNDRRWQAERTAVENINVWLKSRGFKYDFSTSVYKMPYKTLDIDIVLFFMAQVAITINRRNEAVDVYTGRVSEDDKRWAENYGRYGGDLSRDAFKINIQNTNFQKTIEEK